MSVPAAAPSLSTYREASTERSRRVPPVALAAVLGGVVLLFELFVLGRWATGPYFKHVSTGVDVAPAWMRVTFVCWQIAGIVAAVAAFWVFLIRPWIRGRHVTTDGLLVLAFATLWFQDPLSAYFGHWFTYNTNLVNVGSWVSDVPGWHSYGKPGAMIAEPILLIIPVYVYFIMIGTLLGCAAMGAVRKRRPDAHWLTLVITCFIAMCLLDVVGEGFVWLPLGFWEYPGGIGPKLFAGTYHQYPLNEMLTIATIFTGIACLRFFKDASGRTLVERGAERFGHAGTRTALRGLALLGAVHLILFVGYNVPNAIVGSTRAAWPKDLVNRSYLTDHLCGPATKNLCPTKDHGFAVGK